jgi:hypothetical protein
VCQEVPANVVYSDLVAVMRLKTIGDQVHKSERTERNLIAEKGDYPTPHRN